MKFEYDKREPKVFYEEGLYVMLKYREILKKPTMKVKSVVKDLSFFIILGIVALIMQIISYALYGNFIFLVFTGMVIFVIIFLMLILNNSKKQIDVLMNKKGIISVEIDKNNIIYNENNNKKYDMNWSEIAFITINKYSISFIPKNFTGVLILIPAKEKLNLKKYISKNKIDVLVYDNSHKYK